MVENTELAKMLADVRAMTAQIDAATQEQRELRQADRDKHSDEDDKLADERRKGVHGRDWQVLQQRLDLNQTTMDDILFGVDKSEEARAIRKKLEEEALPRMRREFAAALESEDLAEDLEAFKRAQEYLSKTVADMRDRGTG